MRVLKFIHAESVRQGRQTNEHHHRRNAVSAGPDARSAAAAVRRSAACPCRSRDVLRTRRRHLPCGLRQDANQRAQHGQDLELAGLPRWIHLVLLSQDAHLRRDRDLPAVDLRLFVRANRGRCIHPVRGRSEELVREARVGTHCQGRCAGSDRHRTHRIFAARRRRLVACRHFRGRDLRPTRRFRHFGDCHATQDGPRGSSSLLQRSHRRF
jgi:hypothetical protein